MESNIDHIHLMIQYLPEISITQIIHKIKQITTYRIWKEKTFWSDGYFACSIGEANPETIKAYIENQG